jgi:hypothetical protein
MWSSIRFARELKKLDDPTKKDPLLEALERTLEESRRLRGELLKSGTSPGLLPASPPA